MKRLLLFLISFASLFGADCIVPFGVGGGTPITAVGTRIFQANVGGCYTWRLVYNSQGFSALSIKVDSAPDNNFVAGTWVTFVSPGVTNPLQGVNPNTDTGGASAYFNGSPAWISVVLTSATGTGSISGVLIGCRDPGCGNPASGASTVTIAQPVSVTQSGTWTVQPGNTANTTPWLVAEALSATAGATPFLANALTNTVVTVKGSAGNLYGYYCLNPAAANTYIQIFDISGTVTLGTSVPKLSLGIPASANGPGGANLALFGGVNFANAIKVAATTTATGLTAPATAADCNFWFK